MINCDKCNVAMVLDYRHSASFYDSNVTTILDEEADIDFDSLPEEVVYICRRCGAVKVVSLTSVINLIKKKIVKLVLDMRYSFVYQNFDNSTVEESNGVSFCGICHGVVDDSGYCYNDVIKECPVRKILNDKKHITKRGEYKK